MGCDLCVGRAQKVCGSITATIDTSAGPIEVTLANPPKDYEYKNIEDCVDGLIVITCMSWIDGVPQPDIIKETQKECNPEQPLDVEVIHGCANGKKVITWATVDVDTAAVTIIATEVTDQDCDVQPIVGENCEGEPAQLVYDKCVLDALTELAKPKTVTVDTCDGTEDVEVDSEVAVKGVVTTKKCPDDVDVYPVGDPIGLCYRADKGTQSPAVCISSNPDKNDDLWNITAITTIFNGTAYPYTLPNGPTEVVTLADVQASVDAAIAAEGFTGQSTLTGFNWGANSGGVNWQVEGTGNFDIDFIGNVDNNADFDECFVEVFEEICVQVQTMSDGSVVFINATTGGILESVDGWTLVEDGTCEACCPCKPEDPEPIVFPEPEPYPECPTPFTKECLTKRTIKVGYDNGVTPGSSSNDCGSRPNFIRFSWGFEVVSWDVNGTLVGAGDALGPFTQWTPQLQGWSDFFNANNPNTTANAEFGVLGKPTWRFSEITDCNPNAVYGNLVIKRTTDDCVFTVYPVIHSQEFTTIYRYSVMDCDGVAVDVYEDASGKTIEKPEDLACYVPCGHTFGDYLAPDAESTCETREREGCDSADDTPIIKLITDCGDNRTIETYTLDSYLNAQSPDDLVEHTISGKFVNCTTGDEIVDPEPPCTATLCDVVDKLCELIEIFNGDDDEDCPTCEDDDCCAHKVSAVGGTSVGIEPAMPTLAAGDTLEFLDEDCNVLGEGLVGEVGGGGAKASVKTTIKLTAGMCVRIKA